MNKHVSMAPLQSTIQGDVTAISCKFNNYSLKTISYGETFTLERLINGEWKNINDSGRNINFHLTATKLRPFSTVNLSYPVSLYSSFLEDGAYRIAITILYDQDKSLKVYCPFTVLNQ